jgi:hypothetical protein
MFITLEDETGIANLVVWPQVFEKFRRIVMGASIIAVRGRIQREGEVVHLVAHRLVDLSAELGTVGSRDAAFPLSHGRGDQVTHAGDHPARRMALYTFHAQLSRRRRSARGARSGCLLRNGETMGLEVRPIVRSRTSPSTPSANVAMASRRDGRDDCGPAVLAMARG